MLLCVRKYRSPTRREWRQRRILAYSGQLPGYMLIFVFKDPNPRTAWYSRINSGGPSRKEWIKFIGHAQGTLTMKGNRSTSKSSYLITPRPKHSVLTTPVKRFSFQRGENTSNFLTSSAQGQLVSHSLTYKFAREQCLFVLDQSAVQLLVANSPLANG